MLIHNESGKGGKSLHSSSDGKDWGDEKKTADDEKKTAVDEKTRKDGKGTNGKRPRALALNMLIANTYRTLVLKAISQQGTTVAFKVCRQSTTKESADTWRNEMEILSSLDHVSNLWKKHFYLISRFTSRLL